MKDYKTSSIVLLAVLIGLFSGFISGNYLNSIDTLYENPFSMLPGFCFGIIVCLFLKLFLKKNINIFQSIIFIIGSTASYSISAMMIFSTTYSSLFNLIIAGILGGVGVCISFTIFKIKLMTENLILIIISVLSSLVLLLDISDRLFNDPFILTIILWQGTMMGCFAYFTIRKMERENKIQSNSIPSKDMV